MQQDLYSRRLMEKRPASHPEEGDSLSIHRHIKEYIKPGLLNYPARYNQVFTRATHLIRAVFPRQDAGSSTSNYKWPIYAKHYLHVLKLHAAYKEALKQKLPINPPIEFGTLLSNLGNYMYERYLLKDVFEILDTAESVFNKILGPDSIDPERIQVLFIRASIELNHGITKRAQGVRHKEEIVKLRLARLAQVYRGNDKEAREMAAIQLSTAYNNLAWAYMHCEDYAKAEPLLRKSIAIK